MRYYEVIWPVKYNKPIHFHLLILNMSKSTFCNQQNKNVRTCHKTVHRINFKLILRAQPQLRTCPGTIMRQRETVRKKCRVLQKFWADKFLILISFSSLQVIFESLLLKNTIQYCFQNSIKETKIKMLNQIFIVASSEREQVYTRQVYIFTNESRFFKTAFILTLWEKFKTYFKLKRWH